MNLRALLLAAFSLLLCAAMHSLGLAQTATVRESQKVIRTYPYGDPDPVARMNNIYPFYRFDGYSSVAEERSWKIVTLENPYIKVLVAPEIGGKILGAFEKSTGRDFIYFNNVVKFRDIAMRGPWTSGGIEFNFGDIGHAPTTASPVDYLTRRNADGSVSCIVGTIDLPSRTEWRVEIRVPADRAYFETRSFWYNPTDLPTSLYNWSNAAIAADSDLHFQYPGIAHIDHSGNAFPWPVDAQGRDLSWYRNNIFGPSKSYHVLGSYTDFFGALWTSRNFGTVHWSPYAERPGKKLWVWALSREGDIWVDLLTDPALGNRQYVEIQSGLLFNQAAPPSSESPFKHQLFAPYDELATREIWFPVKLRDNICAATPHAALSAEQRNGVLHVCLSPLEDINDDLVITIGDAEVYRKRVRRKPLDAFTDSLIMRRDEPITVTLGNGLVSWKSSGAAESRLARGLSTDPGADTKSIAGKYLQGLEKAKQRDYDGALHEYMECLKLDSLYNPALTGAAEVLCRRLEYPQALVLAARAQAHDAYDPDANFLCGVINRRMGNLTNARDGFGVAARSTKYRAAAHTALAEIAFAGKRFDQAVEYANRSLEFDAHNVRALRILAATYRLTGKPLEAENICRKMLADDPLSHFARCERMLRAPGEKSRRDLLSLIRNEFPHQTLLELAMYYREIGRDGDALQVLSLAPSNPEVNYWIAYLTRNAPDQTASLDHLRQAESASPALVFPFRPESLVPLARADSLDKGWKTKYYQALIHWHLGNVSRATALFQRCGHSPDYAPFYLTRANILKAVDPEGVEKDYQHALGIGKDEWRTYKIIAAHYNDTGRYPLALRVSSDGAGRFPENYMLLSDHARTLLLNGRFADCLALLDTLTILPFEGARYGRETYRQAAMLAGLNQLAGGDMPGAADLFRKGGEWPEHLGSGEPYNADTRVENYLIGLANGQSNEPQKQKERLESVAQYTLSHPEISDCHTLLGALALRSLGRATEAEALMNRWASGSPDDLAARWSACVFHNDTAGAHAVLQQAPGNRALRPWSYAPSDPDFVLLLAAEPYLIARQRE